MKKLLSITLMLCIIFSATQAQVASSNSDVTNEDFERYVDKRLEMNFRLNAMEAIGIMPEEVNQFNAFFDEYTAAKDRLTEKRFDLLEDYVEDMEGENDTSERAETTSDLIEEYWESEIAEMELKESFYDKLENKIPYQKAIDFFIYEEDVENGIIYDIVMPIMPIVVEIETDKNGRMANGWKKKPSDVSRKKYNRYLDARMEMDMRLVAIKELNLTSEEINQFNPVFDSYMAAKDKLSEKKFDLFDEYVEEIQEEEDKDDRAEETSDFIEDYWELEIEEKKLRKDYYDQMENVIPYQKAAEFFLFDETVENRIKHNTLMAKMPQVKAIEKAKLKKEAKKAKQKQEKEKQAKVARENSTKAKEYHRYIDKTLEMDFRLAAMNVMDLTSEEINTFNPLFDAYVTERDEITMKKFELLEDYVDDVRGEDNVAEKMETSSDFVEEYWEEDIAEMKLKKEYFDKMENVLPYQKVLDFFLFEETVERTMRYDIITPAIPTIATVEKQRAANRTRPDWSESKWKSKPSDVSAATYNNYLDKRLEMDFRNAAIEAMMLNTDEIRAFDKYYFDYMKEKDKLSEQKFDLFESYKKDIEGEGSKQERMEESSDFIEEYWEEEIAVMELKKEYFDKMEDDIPYQKVTRFFMFEDAVQASLDYDMLADKMPEIKEVQKASAKKRANDSVNRDRMNENNSSRSDNAMNAETQQAKEQQAKEQMEKEQMAAKARKMEQEKKAKAAQKMEEEKKDKARMAAEEQKMKAQQKATDMQQMEKEKMAAKERKMAQEEKDMATQKMEEEKKKAQMAAEKQKMKAKQNAADVQEMDSAKNKMTETKNEVEQTGKEMNKAANQAMDKTKNKVNDATEEMKQSVDNATSTMNSERPQTTATSTSGSKMSDSDSVPMASSTNNSATVLPTQLTSKSTKAEKQKFYTTYRAFDLPKASELTTLNNWTNSHKGEMSLDHDYTSDGLNAVAAAITATAIATNTEIANWQEKEKEIRAIAQQIQVNPTSKLHADYVKKAFTIIGDAINTLNQENAFTYAHGQVNVAQFWANFVKPQELLLKQSHTVHSFFEASNQALNEIWGYAAKTTTPKKGVIIEG